MKRVMLIAALAIAGCTNVPKPKLLKVETPPGYTCKVHGKHPHAYKVGLKYYCTQCVDENIGQVEMVIDSATEKPTGDLP